MDVTAIGELLIDFTPAGTTEKGIPLFAQNPGGAPANVAVACAKLGLKSAFIGKVGQDSFGDFLCKTLDDERVQVSGIVRDEEIATTLAFVNILPGGERSFTFYRKPGADIRLTWDEVDKELLSAGHFMHFGSVALTDEPSRSTVLQAARYARRQGSIVCYDPNYRPPLWNSQDEARNLMLQGVGLCHVLKVSEEEMLFLADTDDCIEGSRRLADAGPLLVLVTLGGRGAFFRLGSCCGYVPGYQVAVSDTNGAGDTFLGAILYCLRGKTLEQIGALTEYDLRVIVAFANRAASMTAAQSGAIPAMPTLEQVLTVQGKA